MATNRDRNAEKNVARLRKRVTEKITTVDKHGADLVLADFNETLLTMDIREQIAHCRRWLKMYRRIIKQRETWKEN